MRRKPFKVGDKVTSHYHTGESSVVRNITEIRRDPLCGSGYRVWADGGPLCTQCGRGSSMKIYGVDADWFRKVKK